MKKANVYATMIEARRVLANKHARGQYHWCITQDDNGWYRVVKSSPPMEA